MRKSATIALLSLLAAPAMAQDEGLPLIRVYIDAPYFYELVAHDIQGEDDLHRFELVVEGKEVGSASIELNCSEDGYEQTETSSWTGAAEAFVPAAILAYRQLWCGY